MASETLDYMMILVCAVALVILLAFVVYTWIKWHRQQTQFLSSSNEQGPSGIELVGVTAAAPYQRGYVNKIQRDSPNLSGSRTFLGEDVLQQKPFSKGIQPVPQFQTKDVVFHADAERNPNGSVTSSPGLRNSTVDGIDAGHAPHNVDERVEKRWSESTVRSSGSNETEVSHRKNTYL